MKKTDNRVIYVGNLTYDVDEDQLSKFFQTEVGNIVSTRIIRDAGTQQSRGFGFVEFSDDASAAQAIGYNGMDFAGRQLKVNYSEPKRPNNNSRRRNNNHHNNYRGGYQQQSRPQPHYAAMGAYGYNFVPPAQIPIMPNSPPQNQIHSYAPNMSTPPQSHQYQPSLFCSPQQLNYASPQHVHNPAYPYDTASLQSTLSNVSSSSDLNKQYTDNSVPVTITTPEKNDSSSVLAQDHPYGFNPYPHAYTFTKPQNLHEQHNVNNFGVLPNEVSNVENKEANQAEEEEVQPLQTDQIKENFEPSLPPGKPSLPPGSGHQI